MSKDLRTCPWLPPPRKCNSPRACGKTGRQFRATRLADMLPHCTTDAAVVGCSLLQSSEVLNTTPTLMMMRDSSTEGGGCGCTKNRLLEYTGLFLHNRVEEAGWCYCFSTISVLFFAALRSVGSLFHSQRLRPVGGVTDVPLEPGCSKCRQRKCARSLEERVSPWLRAPTT